MSCRGRALAIRGWGGTLRPRPRPSPPLSLLPSRAGHSPRSWGAAVLAPLLPGPLPGGISGLGAGSKGAGATGRVRPVVLASGGAELPKSTARWGLCRSFRRREAWVPGVSLLLGPLEVGLMLLVVVVLLL